MDLWVELIPHSCQDRPYELTEINFLSGEKLKPKHPYTKGPIYHFGTDISSRKKK